MFFKCISDIIFIFLVLIGSSSGQADDSSVLRCINCTDYQIYSAGVIPEEIISCKNGVGCKDSYLKQCQMKLNSYAESECIQVGIFPDPIVDSNYFVCLDDGATGFVKYDFTCPEGNFFDKNTLSCALKAVTSTPSTESSTPLSTEPSSTPSTESSTSPSTEPSSTPSTESSTPPSTEPSSTPSTELSSASTSTQSSTSTLIPSKEPSFPPTTIAPMTSTQPPTLLCITPGIFPNPKNCKMYFRCSTSLKIFHYICPGNSYFNEILLKCSLIISPLCQEQILKNSTTLSPIITTPTSTSITATTTTASTTLPPSTTIITSSTISLPSSTSLASTTTTIGTLATTTNIPTFSCSTSGITANPVDCKSYYRCSVSGQIFRYVCPGNTYFNENTLRCSLVITSRCKNLIQG